MADSVNIADALMDAGIHDHLNSYDIEIVETFALSKYEYDELPDAFHKLDDNETVQD